VGPRSGRGGARGDGARAAAVVEAARGGEAHGRPFAARADRDRVRARRRGHRLAARRAADRRAALLGERGGEGADARRAAPCRRGAILDAEGRALATTRPTWDLDFDFGAFRKGTAAGQLLLVHFLLTGERSDVARVLADPAPIVAELAALTVGQMRGLEPGARRADLLVYAAWLVGDRTTKELVERLRHAPDDALCCPRIAAASAILVARVAAEAALLADLERALALPRGELAQGMAKAIAASDARVKRALDKRQRSGPLAKLYEAERDLHKDVDARTATLARNVRASTSLWRSRSAS
jgi:hypothetical protein